MPHRLLVRVNIPTKTDHDHIKLIGLGQLGQERVPLDGGRLGVYAYLCPELLEGYDDLLSLGVAGVGVEHEGEGGALLDARHAVGLADAVAVLVLPASLIQQFLGLVRVIVVPGLVVRVVGPGEVRHGRVGHSAQAKDDAVHHRLAVQRVEQGLARAHVQEQRVLLRIQLVDVEREAKLRVRLAIQMLHLQCFFPQRRGHVFANVYLACLELGELDDRVLYDLEVPKIKIRLPPEVVRVLDQRHVVVLDPLAEHVRPGADRRQGVELGRVELVWGEITQNVLGDNPLVGLAAQEGGVHLAELELDGIIVQDHDLLRGQDVDVIGAADGVNVFVQHRFVGELDVVRREWLTVVPRDVVAQVEGEGQAVVGDFPPLGQFRYGGEVFGIDLRQAVEQHAVDLERGVVSVHDGVQVHGIGKGALDDRAARGDRDRLRSGGDHHFHFLFHFLLDHYGLNHLFLYFLDHFYGLDDFLLDYHFLLDLNGHFLDDLYFLDRLDLDRHFLLDHYRSRWSAGREYHDGYCQQGDQGQPFLATKHFLLLIDWFACVLRYESTCERRIPPPIFLVPFHHLLVSGSLERDHFHPRWCASVHVNCIAFEEA